MSRSDVYVPSTGPRNAKIMLVGESPGPTDADKGLPFLGSSGTELDKMLSTAGIRRDEVFITNACHYMPGVPDERKREWFFESNGTTFVPTPRFMDGIKELQADIRSVQPNVVVPVGNYALWALTGFDSISKYRGSILEAKLWAGTKVVPTFHPAYILRQWNHRPLVIWDFLRVKAQSKFPEIRLPQRDFIIHPTQDQILNVMDRLLNAKLLSIDIECSPNRLTCCGYTDDPSWGICIPSGHEYDWAHRLLLSSDVPKVGQNIMFEKIMLTRFGYDLCNVKADTMVAWHYCWPDLGSKSLDTIASVLTEEPYYKDDVMWSDDKQDLTTLYNYNCKDICVTLEAWNALDNDELPYCNARRSYNIPMSIFDVMAEATNFGIKASRERLCKHRDMYQDKADRLNDLLNQTIGYEINVRSPVQVADLVYENLGLKVGKTRTTDQPTLMDFAVNTQDSFIRGILTIIVKIRSYRKLVSSYLQDEMIDPDGRARCAWNLAGTDTGRLAATQTFWGSGTSLQTIPEECKDIYMADEGYIFIGHDLDQAEARIVAYLTHDEQLLEWMYTGIDIHRKLASLLPFGKTYEQLLEMPKDCRERFIAKKCRHALNYRMGPLQFQKTVNREYDDTGIGITASEAKALHNRYLTLHPNLKLWWKQVESQLQQSMYLENPFGRGRRFTQRWGNDLHMSATAQFPQSTVGDLTTIGIRTVADRAPWIKPLIHIHDGTIMQVPAARKKEALAILNEAMTIPFKVERQMITIPVTLYEGPDWGSMKKVSL